MRVPRSTAASRATARTTAASAHPATRRRGSGTPSRHAAESGILRFVGELVAAPASAGGRVYAGVGEAALHVMRGARDTYPGLRHATVVLPQSASPAWFAAAATLGLTPLVVPVDGEGRVAIGPMTAAIREDTVLVVASTPSYTHGATDPVAWIAAATAARGVPLHVDAASGGWALAYAARAGRVGPAWNFAVPGVTSISIDVGPEGGAPSELTAVINRDAVEGRTAGAAALLRGPLDLPATWTRAGALLGDVAETLAEVGHRGCARLAAEALDATGQIVTGLLEQRGVHLATLPDATTISLRTDQTCDAFTLADALHRRGWTVHPVMPEVGPPLLRLPITAAMLPMVDEMLVAVATAVFEAQDRGRAQVDPTLERLLVTLDPDDVSEYNATLLLEAAAVLDESAGRGEGRRSATNLLLAAASPGVREALLAVHLDRLVMPMPTQPSDDRSSSSE